MRRYAFPLAAMLSLAGLPPSVASAQFVVVAPAEQHAYVEFLHGLFDGIVPELNETFTIPRTVSLTSGRCEQANAFYVPDGSTIVFCIELVDRIREGTAESTSDEGLQALVLVSQVAFILIHELGHALVDVLDLPIPGQEEDAADQLAALMMVDEPILAMWAAEFWRSPAAGAGQALSSAAFADQHDLSQQRFFNLTCWTFGADPLVRGYVATHAGLPAARAQRCAGEYQRLRSSWERVLAPHMRSAGGFADLDPTRNASGYWRFMESMQDPTASVRCTASGTLSLWEAGGDLSGAMTQDGSCVWAGVPIDNAAEAAITTGTAEGGRVTFTISNCEYVGTIREPDRTLVEGTVTCPVAQADGNTMSLTGSWTAVR